MIQQSRNLGVNTAPRHLHILSHADLGMAQVIGTHPRREYTVVNQRRDRLTQTIGSHVGHAELVANFAPLGPEVARIAQRPGRGREDHHLFAEVRP